MAVSGSSAPANSFTFRTVRRLASFLLPLGVGAGEFGQISKAAFVAAAADHIRSRGGRISTSQISVITGLPRADVAAIRSSRAKKTTRDGVQRTARVMHAWFSDSSYADANGNPRPLRPLGRGSFRELVRRFGGDVTPNAVLRELIAGGMAKIAESGEVVPLRRYHQAEHSVPLNLDEIQRDLDVALTCCLTHPRSAANTVRRVSVSFDGHIGAAVRRNVSIRIQRFLDALSEYLHGASKSSAFDQIGVGQSEVLNIVVAHSSEIQDAGEPVHD